MLLTFRPKTDGKSSFWIIAGAVKKFYEEHKCLPVPGSLPDMKAQSKVYIQLQNIYKEKARRDANEVLATARKTPGGEDIDSSEVELFCKNARFIKLINAGQDEATKMEQVVGKSGVLIGAESNKFRPLMYMTCRARTW